MVSGDHQGSQPNIVRLQILRQYQEAGRSLCVWCGRLVSECAVFLAHQRRVYVSRILDPGPPPNPNVM